MAVRVAINGFGRIGRLAYRAMLANDFFDNSIEVVAINDLVPADNLAYLLKYDSIHRKLDTDISAPNDHTLKVGDREIKVLSERAHPSELPWADHNIDIVIEATGLFAKAEDANGHINAGAKKVIITAPSGADVATVLVGVNHNSVEPNGLTSNASCTTNCLGPIVKVLIDSGIGLSEGLMTTIHGYTSTQALIDGPSKKDLRRGRAAAINVIPTTTGAAKATEWVIPEIAGKLTGMAVRVPVPDTSFIDLTFKPNRPSSLEEIRNVMKDAAQGELRGILEYTEEPIVSSDVIGNTHSAVFDATASMELNDSFFKLIAWYDNEWGYSNRIAELTAKVASKMMHS